MLVPMNANYNKLILKEISPGISLEGMMLKLKLQYFGHLMWRVDLLEKTLMLGGTGAGGEGGDRGWDGWMASLTRWRWVWVNSGSWWWTEAWCAAIHGVTKSRTRLSDWTELICWVSKGFLCMNPFDPYNPIITPVSYRWGNWDTEKEVICLIPNVLHFSG